jgi:hypothetical protein
MALKALLDSLEGIDAPFHSLYTEKNGKFELTGIEGVKTQADIDRLNAALAKERTDRKAFEDKIKSYEPLGDPTEVLAKLDRIPELEAAAKGKLDDAQIDAIVEGRIKSKLSPVEREKAQMATKLQEALGLVEQFQTRERTRNIHDAVRKVATEVKVLDTAQEDVLMCAERIFEIDANGNVVTRDNVGVTPGISPKEWLADMTKSKPHWWPASQGGGAKGSGGGGGFAENPWAADSWNMTKQGQVMRQDAALADRMAKAAGTKIGGPRPAIKK